MKNKILFACVSAALLVSCGKSPDVAGGVETGNGIMAGIVASSAGIGDSVEVMLVPETFKPIDSTLDRSLIDTTNAKGEYSISAPAGTYNLVARSGDKKEVTIVRKVVVTTSQSNVQIQLEPAVACTISLGSVAVESGALWFIGTPFVGNYQIGDSEIVFSSVAKVSALPPVYKSDSKGDALFAESLRFAKSVSLRNSAGFPDYSKLYYDAQTSVLCAGTKYDGFFTYNDNPTVNTFLSQTQQGKVPQFKSGISHITGNSKGSVLIASGEFVVQYQNDSFVVVDSGNKPVKGIAMIDSKPLIAYSDSVKIGSLYYALSGVTSIASRNDSAFVGTTSGVIQIITDSAVGTMSVDGAVNRIYPLKTGKILVVVPKGILLVNNGVVEHEWSQFVSTGEDSPVGISESGDGSVWIVTKTNRVYNLGTDLQISRLLGFESLIPSHPKTKIKDNAVDCATDLGNNCWILFEEGAMMRITF